MGYDIRVRGEIKIEPLPTIEQLELLHNNGFGYGPQQMASQYRDVRYKVTTTTKADGPYRTVTDIEDVTLVAVTESSFSAGQIDTDLADIVRLLGDGHTYTGILRGRGEFYVQWSIKDGQVMHEYAKLIWPDGTIEEIDL